MRNFSQFVGPLLAACLVTVLAGCSTVTNSLTTEQIGSFRYVGTSVSFDPKAAIWWGDGERAYAATKGVAATESEEVAKTPEGQAYMRSQIVSKVKAAMDRNFEGKLTGTRGVRIEVVVKSVTIPSAVQRVVIGGSHMMQAGINLVDAQTGKVLLSHPGMVTVAATGQGVVGTIVDGIVADPPLDRVTRSLAQQYRNWLIVS